MRVAIAIVLALLFAPAAKAGPVIGSGSLNDAPVLEPGEFSDTILPGEQLFYGIRVEAGESISVQARSALSGERFRKLVALLRFRAIGPLREPVGFDAEADVREDGGPARFEAGPAADDSSDPYLGTGTWYVGVHAFWGGSTTPPKAEIPFTFSIERMGSPAAAPSPTATPAAAPRRTVVDDEVDSAAIGAIGMSGLILGMAGGALAGRRRR